MAKKALSAFMKSAAKRNQEGAVKPASQASSNNNWRIPTGSIDLDYGLGGGLKVGAVTMFWGKKSGGKTSSALRTCGNAQKKCRNCYRKAHSDTWTVFSNESIAKLKKSLEAGEADGKSTGEVMTRSEAHGSLIALGYSPIDMSVLPGEAYLYDKGEGENVEGAAIMRVHGDPESVKPEEDEDRWEANGFCDCFEVGIYEPDEPTPDDLVDLGFADKKPTKKSKAHRESLAAWRASMSMNSYDETVVAWFDEEMTLDSVWAERLGVDTRRLLLVWSNSAEEAIDIMASLIFTSEVDMLVIDSIAQLTPKKELTESADAWQQGLAARLINKAIRRWNKEAANVARYSKRPVTQIWINQEREKIGVMFGSPATMPGGLGQGFQVVAEAKFRHGKTEKVEEVWGDKAKGEILTIPVWEEFHYKITKSKSGSGAGLREVTGSYKQSMRDTSVYPAGTVIDWERVFKMALNYLVDQTKKGSSSVYKLGTREYTSQAAILRDLREDPVFYETVRQSLLHDVMLREM